MCGGTPSATNNNDDNFISMKACTAMIAQLIELEACKSKSTSGQSLGAAAELRNSNNAHDYVSVNDNVELQENIKMSLISMWIVVALMVVANVIFVWCYMKRNKEMKSVYMDQD